MRSYALLAGLSCVLALSVSCGGGGGGHPSAVPSPVVTPQVVPLAITTSSFLPSAVKGHAYSTTLAATGGSGALHWSISPVNSTSPFVNGLVVDANSGVLSGTANFAGAAGFIAQVTDSSSPVQSVTQNFTITAFGPLTTGTVLPVTVQQFQNPILISSVPNSIQGGVPPFGYAMVAGALPPGIKMDAITGFLFGGAFAAGTFQATINVHDSFSPPESVSVPITVTVVSPSLTLANSIPAKLALNRVFSGSLVATGGVKPYTFSISSGALPAGLNLTDPATGKIGGTPIATGTSSFVATVTDSSSPVQSAPQFFNITVAPPLGRNDTPATATKIGNGIFTASISPYIDPPNGALVAGDSDYFKLLAAPGAIVHVQTSTNSVFGKNPLDTVMEILDANGARLNTCQQPGDMSNKFISPCLNDDISASPHIRDSALDFKVPINASPVLTLLVHVLDFRGDARPDMQYSLQVNGAVDPLVISNNFLIANVGIAFSQQLFANGGLAPIAWSLSSGSLPPGFSLAGNGLISGTTAVAGPYSFTVKASDAAAQTATQAITLRVF